MTQAQRILFLDQSGQLGGAELCLMDLVMPYRDRCLVGLFADGPYRHALEQRQIPVEVLTDQALRVSKSSTLSHSLTRLKQILPLIKTVIKLSSDYDLIYANTQKAFVISAIASFFRRRHLVYHLHDILSEEHFSHTNLKIAVTLANQCATLVIANSAATKASFIKAGGNPNLVHVVYNGFDPVHYHHEPSAITQLRQQMNLSDRFVIGHFSRLSPWKGQHILIEALAHCPDNITAILVGDALFGETAYVNNLQEQVQRLGLQDRVQFLGFRQDIPQLMALCDLVTHTSTAPEAFGRVIVEAMLCGTPVVAAAAGGAVELVQSGKTGWLVEPGNVLQLASIIRQVQADPLRSHHVAQYAYAYASQQFPLERIHQQISTLLENTFRSD